MNDDLGTPSAVATIFDLVHEINVRNSKSQGITEGVNLLKDLLNILGFDTEYNKLEDKDIIDLLEKRNNFRIEKKYDQADKIRDKLLDLGIEILDSKDGSTYRKILNLTFRTATPTNITIRIMVNLKRICSMPLLDLNDPSD